jgi:hypothetical protein
LAGINLDAIGSALHVGWLTIEIEEALSLVDYKKNYFISGDGDEDAHHFSRRVILT